MIPQDKGRYPVEHKDMNRAIEKMVGKALHDAVFAQQLLGAPRTTALEQGVPEHDARRIAGIRAADVFSFSRKLIPLIYRVPCPEPPGRCQTQSVASLASGEQILQDTGRIG
jgi:hypothetical protein